MVAFGTVALVATRPQSTIVPGGTKKLQTIDDEIAELRDNFDRLTIRSSTFGNTTAMSELGLACVMHVHVKKMTLLVHNALATLQRLVFSHDRP